MLHLRQFVTKYQAGINISTSASATRRIIITRTTKATSSAIFPLRSSSSRVALHQHQQKQQQKQEHRQQENCNRFINGTSFLQVQNTLSARLGVAGQHLRQRQSEKNLVSTPRPPSSLSLRRRSQHSLPDPQPVYNRSHHPLVPIIPSFLHSLKKPSIIIKRAELNNSNNIPKQRNMSSNGNSTTNGNSNSNGNSTSTSTSHSHSHINFHDDHGLSELLARNEKWAGAISETHQTLFPETGLAQNPKILWLGCSDSRCPETTLLDLCPGEVFVHRNIANCLPPTDLSCQSVIEFSVVHVKVKHVIVCGHYGCGGVQNALSNKKLGILDLWLKNVKAVAAEHAEELEAIKNPEEREKRLVHLNVIAQTQNLLRNSNVQEAMKNRGMQVHSLVYDVACGKLIKVDIPADKKRKAFMLEE